MRDPLRFAKSINEAIFSSSVVFPFPCFLPKQFNFHSALHNKFRWQNDNLSSSAAAAVMNSREHSRWKPSLFIHTYDETPTNKKQLQSWCAVVCTDGNQWNTYVTEFRKALTSLAGIPVYWVHFRSFYVVSTQLKSFSYVLGWILVFRFGSEQTGISVPIYRFHSI